jgi:hypothetical protein
MASKRAVLLKVMDANLQCVSDELDRGVMILHASQRKAEGLANRRRAQLAAKVAVRMTLARGCMSDAAARTFGPARCSEVFMHTLD